MAINVPATPAPVLTSVSLIEQRTYGGTAYPTLQRTYVDAAGEVAKVEADAPQVQLNLDEWPDLQKSHTAYTVLLEKASAYLLGHTESPWQAHVYPEVPI